MGKSLAQASRQADAIICVSQSTAAEVEDYVGGGIGARIRVVPEGVSPEFSDPADPACLRGLDLSPEGVPFVLTAGKISPRKNVQGVLRAMSKISDEVPHHLVLVGGDGWDVEVVSRELRDAPGLSSRVHFTGYVSDLQLRAIYAMASVYVHPSFYEGFGLTVLEAMACGTPVVASDRTSLPEVVGDSGRLVDPEDASALAEAILEICLDPSTARRMSGLGRARAATFTWKECAAKVAEVYSDVTR
jgi:glycosyltransferase involved in cell wall biosynthesis